MYAVLLATALVIGSGDSRGGATADRAVENVPPYILLRKGMTSQEVWKFLGNPNTGISLSDEQVIDIWIPRQNGRVKGRTVFVTFRDHLVVTWKVGEYEEE